MKSTTAAFVLTGAIALGACNDDPVRPNREPDAALVQEAREQLQAALVQAQQQRRRGTGLVLESLTGLTLPLIPVDLGDIVIDQAVLTNFFLVEDVVGSIVGLEVEGLIDLTGGVLGSDVVTEDFRAVVSVASSGPGRCRLLGVDLGPMQLDILGETVEVNLPVATVNTRSAGAVGVLLCIVGQLLETTITDPLTGLVRALVDVINRLLI